jgi:hypothetical protein
MDVDAHLEKTWKKVSEKAAKVASGQPIGSAKACYYNISGLSKEMWGATDCAALYATHRALALDTMYFFRIKTRPPTYQAREQAEVHRMQRQKVLERAQPLPLLFCQSVHTQLLYACCRAPCRVAISRLSSWKLPQAMDAVVAQLPFEEQNIDPALELRLIIASSKDWNLGNLYNLLSLRHLSGNVDVISLAKIGPQRCVIRQKHRGCV